MKKFTTETAIQCRDHFPALKRRHGDRPAVFFDGPAGTQVPQSVVDAMGKYLLECNANHGGFFATSQQSDQWLDEGHQAFADFVGADHGAEICFGQNMTSLTFAFSRALAKTWTPGDEIVVTRLDHDANVSPWVTAANDAGVTVHKVPFLDSDYTLDLEKLESVLNEKTRLVAVGCASNATGGLNPVKTIAEKAHQVGAQVFLDAVHFGPHGLIDVKDWGCDYLACSAYKFFGPHLGILWGKRELLDSLEAYRVRPAGDQLPGKWMTGTQSHESIVGAMACVDYLAGLGRDLSGHAHASRREALAAAFAAITEYEQHLSQALIEGLQAIPGVKIYGITDLNRLADRFPTVSITHDQIATTTLAQKLAAAGIYVWHGNYYALEFTESLDLEPEGMIRIGLVHYNTTAEIQRLLDAMQSIVMAAA